MERFLAQLCGTSALQPLPVWEGDTTGHCFTQLVLSALPHALLAVLSACHWGNPRNPGYIPRCSPGWRVRLAASFVLSIFPLLDLFPVVLPPGAGPGPIGLEVLAGGVSAVAWISHSLALWVLAHSPHGRSRGPLALTLTAFLPAPALVLTLLWHCQRGTLLPPLLPGPLSRLCLLILQLAALLAYGLGWAVPGRPQEPWAQEPLLSEGQEPEVAEDGESWLSRFSYAWLAPLLARGARGELRQPQDTCRLPDRLHPTYLARVFQAQWQEGARMWRALYGALGQRYLALGLLKLVGTMLGFSGPLLLSLLVGFLEEGQEPLSNGLLYALGLAGGAVLGAVLQNQYGYEVRKVTLQARGAVLNILYRKALQLGPRRPPSGEVLNLLGTDSERLLNFAGSFHEAWGLPLQLAITLYLLHQQVDVAFVGGLILALLLVPVNKVIATRIMASNQEMLQHKDARVKLVTELLSGIRVIKFFGWEQALGARVEACRARELGRLWVIKYLDAACVYLWAALPVVISIVIFITYVLMGHQLTATKVFTALALVHMLILPLNNFPWVINGLLEAKVSLDRIQRFLDLPNHSPQAYYSPDPPTEPSTALELHEALFSWDPVGTSQETFISHLEVKKGMLVGIVGKVGCGKSSLLAAIAGELHRQRGRVAVWRLSKGFGLATQEPWIQFATIRDNILFGKTFDAQLYKEVLEACALDDDLSILPAGDQTEVGEKGVTLSGGQRARIALARAVYQEKELYLLDDPLAAVDADVANHLLHRCILGVLSHTTRLLCTHRTEYLERADVVLLMEAGRLVQAGPPSEILPLVQAAPKAWAEDGQESDPVTAQSVQNPEKTKEGLEVEESTSGRLLQEESKKEGAVAFHVYRAYWRAMGWGLALAILFSLLLMQATRNSADWWLSHWISQLEAAKNSSQEAPAPSSLGSAGPLSAQLLSFSPGSLYALCSGHPPSSCHPAPPPAESSPHAPLQGLLEGAAAPGQPHPVSSLHPPGRHLGRPPCAPGHRHHPQVSSEEEAFYGQGVWTGRCSCGVASPRFEEENQRLLELNQRCQFAASATMQWLDIRLQFMGAAVVSAIAGIALVQHQQGLANPGLVGLSLSYALSLTGLLSGLVSSFTQTEAMLVSVERLEEYSCDLPQEPQGQRPQLGIGWLSQGSVEFQDVVLVYRPGLPNALDGVTFCVQPGEKLGIVGRTGSGKSSLLLVLFRLLEPSSGRVLLDGVDTSQLELAELRSQLAIIPQEPFLFSGTVRENLDPRGLYEDRALWQALEQCHLSEVIISMGGLDGELGEGGRSLSLGQRQLLCLARALLTDAKILCIDEATASVDQKTDQLLQQTICKRFANKTVLTIAHRLNTILNSDRVLVLQAGRVAELDSPAVLRSQPHSLFQQLLQSSQQGARSSP
ncbi:ATP-binding cassette sub-family C member 10 isoform X5 [Balaenoptera ricei]|uniref:ATP-binding cassette sub-family C member 10 isoform X5 n=1 Tax=Balaenoptera ricei TaxID=2746895 RepID=UPI0028BD19FF|nr:ATP-binding cassette sub-family C member 10 isoform X5 [Balaenoptera ricei]